MIPCGRPMNLSLGATIVTTCTQEHPLQVIPFALVDGIDYI